MSHIPSISDPLLGSGYLTQLHGGNREIYKDKFGLEFGHNGIDWGAAIGTPVVACDDGVVTEVETDPDGYGNYVKMAHVWGHSIYAHLSRTSVLLGENVARQGQIGEVGSSGFSTGPHLHFGIRVQPWDIGPNRMWVNPLPYLWRGKWIGRSRLAAHWMNETGPEHTQAMIDMQPPMLKLMKGIWSNYSIMEILFSRLPDTVFVLRDHEMSEQKDFMDRAPVAAAISHVEDWHGKLEAMGNGTNNFDWTRVIVEGINEPYVEDDAKRERVIMYNNHAMDMAHSKGMIWGAYNFSIGHPSNRGIPDAPQNWSYYERSRIPLVRGGHMLDMHIYWPAQGPSYDDRWYADSHNECPWYEALKYIGECFVDAVAGSTGGFRSNGMTPEEMINQADLWERLYLHDDVCGAFAFTWGNGGDPRWDAFRVDTQDMRPLFVQYVLDHKTGGDTDPPLPPPITPPIEPQPPGGGDTMKIYDAAGHEQTWEWMQAKYGPNIQVHPAEVEEGRYFKLVRIQETIGPITAVVRVLGENGGPARNNVAFSWADAPHFKEGCQTSWTNKATFLLADTNGYVGFGLGPGGVIKDGKGPHDLWVCSPKLKSDVYEGLGWEGGTNHAGMLSLVFQIVEAAPVYETLVGALEGEAEKNDVIRINPAAALVHKAILDNPPGLLFWATSNEFDVVDPVTGDNYRAQRFRNPGNDVALIYYTKVDEWSMDQIKTHHYVPGGSDTRSSDATIYFRAPDPPPPHISDILYDEISANSRDIQSLKTELGSVRHVVIDALTQLRDLWSL